MPKVSKLPIVLAILAFGTVLLPATGAQAEKIGVASAVTPTVTGTPPGAQQRVLAVGLNIQRNERVITTKVGRAQLLFLDGTALTLGPNSKVVLDRFIYNPHQGKETLALNLARGALRLVGGKISKVNPIRVATPVATVGIRGGISIIFYEPGQPMKALFLFGADMSVSSKGTTEDALRPGSIITVGSDGQLSPAHLATSQEVEVMLAPLLRVSGKGPASFVKQVNEAANRTNDAANRADAPPIGGAFPNSSDETGGSENLENLALNADHIVANSLQKVQSTSTSTSGSGGNSGSVSLGPSAGGEVRAPGYDKSSFDSDTEEAGRDTATNTTMKSLDVKDGSLDIGFDNGDAANLPYAAGSSPLLNSSNNSNNFSGPIIGGGVITSDQSFFFYNGLLSGSSAHPAAIFGGDLTTSAGFPTTGYAAYALNDVFNGLVPFYPIADFDAATDSPPEDIAALTQNGTVSSLFAAFNRNLSFSQQGTSGPAQFQASLGIEGQGASQTSFLIGEVGGLVTESSSKGIALGGAIRGFFQEDASTLNYPYFIAGNVASAEVTGAGTVVGNAIFGPSANDMVLVPDQVGPNGAGDAVQRTAGAIGSGTIGQWQSSGLTSNYAVVEASQTTAPPGLGTSRTAQTLQGYAGAIMASTDGSSEILTNMTGSPTDVSITTDPANNRLQATFNLSSTPSSSPQPGVMLDFGNFPGDTQATSAFIDNNLFAARETAAPGHLSSATVVQGGTLVTSTVTAQLLMVSANAVPLNTSNGFLPTGVHFCTCSFLNWGYWEGTLQHTAASDPQKGMVSGILVATWVAGTVSNPSSLPSSGTATYAGHIIGNVINGGNAYLAVGSFQNKWDFSSRTGAINVNSFDNASFTGSASAAAGSASFNGTLSGSKTGVGTLTGTLNGSFFKSASDAAAGMAGAFSITGSSYKAAGTFAAQK